VRAQREKRNPLFEHPNGDLMATDQKRRGDSISDRAKKRKKERTRDATAKREKKRRLTSSRVRDPDRLTSSVRSRSHYEESYGEEDL